MDSSTKKPTEQQDDSSSLEGSSPSAEPDASPVVTTDSLENSGGDTSHDASTSDTAATSSKPQSSPKGIVKKLRGRLNVYLLFFVLILVVAGAILLFTIFKGSEEKDPVIGNQTLSEDALKQLANTEATVGDPKQILNIQSNAVFAGKVLVRDSLDVAGQINVGGAMSMPGITVSGDSRFDQVQVSKAIEVGGDASVQGGLTVRKNISINGSGNFGGPLSAPQITTSALQLIGDLNLTRHVIAGGATPGRSIGGAVGGGGTGSVSGSDNGGSININTGSGTAAGCLITVNFVNRYNNTPHVVITPVGSAAAGLDYYINRTTSSFSVCTLNAPPDSASFGFDYFVLG